MDNEQAKIRNTTQKNEVSLLKISSEALFTNIDDIGSETKISN